MDDPREPLFDVGDELTEKDENAYTIHKFIDRGGTGEVYQLNSSLHGSSRAYKLFIPFYFLDRLSRMGMGGPSAPEVTAQVFQHFETLQISESEYRTLAQLNHPYIATVHDRVRVTLPPKALSRLREQFGLVEEQRASFGIISSYVDGESLTDFAQHASPKELFTALAGIAQALDYLNLDARVLHCDIKPSNVLIRRRDSLPVVVDFGLAQSVEGDMDRMIAVATQLLPSYSHVQAASDIRRRLLRDELVSKQEFLDAYFPWLDRYQFGLLLQEVVQAARFLSTSDSDYLGYVSRHLTNQDWLAKRADEPIAGLVERVDANRVYPFVRTGARAEDVQIPSPGRPVTVPKPLTGLAFHPALIRLNRQSQLGLLPARFPGARHSRYLHSLDTYRLTRAFARKLLDVPGFRAEMDESDVTKLLVAALYHDLNHLPFLHVFQEFGDGKAWLPDPVEVACSYAPPGSATLDEALRDAGMSRDDLMMRVRPDKSVPCSDAAVTIARSILDSAVDMDKLSYLQLDGWHSGLPFAADLNITDLFSAAEIAPLASPTGTYEAGALVVSYPEAALDLVEDVVRARTEAFETLYWCDENRAMMAAFSDAVRAIVQAEGGERQLHHLVSDSAGLSDDEFLGKLDELADGAGASTFRIRRFFDGAWRSLRRVASVSDQAILASLRRLPASRVADYEAGVRTALLGTARGDLLLDIPGRDLDLGGPVFVVGADGRAYDGGSLPCFEGYVQRLRTLSARVAVYATEDVLDQLGSTAEARDSALRTALMAAKARDNWD